MQHPSDEGRSLGLMGATGVGVGAIVGGGILALAGVAFATTGPGAMLAFGLNGLIAILTALSMAEMSSAFPESGGTYTFAKKVLTVEAAFAVGWVVWFASILAAVLYALGFASYGMLALEQLAGDVLHRRPGWLFREEMETVFALVVISLYTSSLIRKATGGRQWATAGKVIAFGVLIVGGLWVLAGRPSGPVRDQLRPFFPFGATGLFQAMGYTFIALQGADLIAAVAGEVRNPERTIPKAMFLSLGTALAIYLPLLLVISTVGMEPGQSVTKMSAISPDTIVAVAAENFLGRFGFWLVVVAAILSMLSALRMNLLAASRMALVMARDRTFPSALGRIHKQGTPATAILASALTATGVLVIISDVPRAGAVSSLIFLVSFALAHWTAILMRRRSPGTKPPFRVPFFPVVPVVGAIACLALALFQGIEVPTAGLLVGGWLVLGAVLFLLLFARRARSFDASSEAQDPNLVQLRGRSPLVLVPVANPAHTKAMVTVAQALATPNVGRVLLLSVVTTPGGMEPAAVQRKLSDMQDILRNTFAVSIDAGVYPEALTTVAPQPWPEISRVARTHRCACLLLGFTRLTETLQAGHLEDLMNNVDCDVVVLRAPEDWKLQEVRKILVPVGGMGTNDVLRARLLSSLYRTGIRHITFLRILPDRATREAMDHAGRMLSRLAQDEVPEGRPVIETVTSEDIGRELIRRVTQSDLTVLGLPRLGRRRKVFGDLALRVVRETRCPIIMISRR